VGLEKTYLPIAAKEDIDAINPMNLNEVLEGQNDMIWTWWHYPQVQYFKRSRECLYWTYTTSDGYGGVAQYDYRTGKTIKNHLKKNSSVDDHNVLAVHVRSNGHIIAAYSSGHDYDRFLHIRHSTARENIEHFEDEIVIESSANVTYAQIHEYNNVIFIFYRRNSKDWVVISSNDGGYTWTSEEVVVHSTVQYYVLFKPTTTTGVLRMVMYSNPTAGEPEIRQGFLHFDTWGIYDTDNTTLLGTSNVDYTDFTTLIALEDAESKPYQRFLDVAVTAPTTTRILYCQFSDDTDGDAIYQLYSNGTSYDITAAGAPFWIPKYQGGCSFISDHEMIVISNKSDNKDYVDLYSFANNTITKVSTIYSEANGTEPIRCGRPIVDINGHAVIWHRGYYNPNGFTDFNTDAMIYDLDTGAFLGQSTLLNTYVGVSNAGKFLTVDSNGKIVLSTITSASGVSF